MEATPKIHKRKHRRHQRSQQQIANGQLSDTENELQQQQPTTSRNGGAEIDDVRNGVASTSAPTLHHNDSTETIVPAILEADDKLQKGILGYMDRQLKVQTLAEPPRSPAQRSTRSRSSNETKSPSRSKRSKSESRRRRERKIIAAGELEVQQANETLMKYLKQCSDLNEASLSGDIEIEPPEDRRVHRKTKAERQKRLHSSVKSGRFTFTSRNFIHETVCGRNTARII